MGFLGSSDQTFSDFFSVARNSTTLPDQKEIMAYINSNKMPKPLALLMPSRRALFSSNPAEKVHYFCGVQGKSMNERPIANILDQHDKLENMTAYLNYKPSSLELGILWRNKVRNIYYPKSTDPLVIGLFNTTNDGYKLNEQAEKTIPDFDETQIQAFELQNPEIKAAIQSPCQHRTSIQKVPALLKNQFTVTLQKRNERQLQRAKTQQEIDEGYIRIVLGLVDRYWSEPNQETERPVGNNIAAIMVDANNEVIGWGLNIKSINKNLHAEISMIEAYKAKHHVEQLPKGTRIYTSLQCCHMCATHIVEHSENTQVIYAMHDPYFKENTALTNGENGCSEAQTTLNIANKLAETIEQSDKGILEFLQLNSTKELLHDASIPDDMSSDSLSRLNNR